MKTYRAVLVLINPRPELVGQMFQSLLADSELEELQTCSLAALNHLWGTIRHADYAISLRPRLLRRLLRNHCVPPKLKAFGPAAPKRSSKTACPAVPIHNPRARQLTCLRRSHQAVPDPELKPLNPAALDYYKMICPLVLADNPRRQFRHLCRSHQVVPELESLSPATLNQCWRTTRVAVLATTLRSKLLRRLG